MCVALCNYLGAAPTSFINIRIRRTTPSPVPSADRAQLCADHRLTPTSRPQPPPDKSRSGCHHRQRTMWWSWQHRSRTNSSNCLYARLLTDAEGMTMLSAGPLMRRRRSDASTIKDPRTSHELAWHSLFTYACCYPDSENIRAQAGFVPELTINASCRGLPPARLPPRATVSCAM